MYLTHITIPFTDNPQFTTFSSVSVVMCCRRSTITDIPSSPMLLKFILSTCRVQFLTNSLLTAIAPVVFTTITISYIATYVFHTIYHIQYVLNKLIKLQSVVNNEEMKSTQNLPILHLSMIIHNLIL